MGTQPPPAQKPRPSGYSYVSTPPPESPMGGRQRNVTPHQTHGPGTSGYLSTPVPAGEKPTTPERTATAPQITPYRVHANWRYDPSLHLERRRPLSDQLFPLAVQGCFVLGVTGLPDMREHKSRVAAEIALALGEARHPRVLLVEGDFQWPTVHTLMHIDMPRSSGFSQQLRSRAAGRAEHWTVMEVGPSLHVLAEGIMRSPGLILSSHFEDSLRAFRAYYDFVVVDGPLTSSEVDCRALDAVVDGIVIVAPGPGSRWLTPAMQMFPDKRFSIVVSPEG